MTEWFRRKTAKIKTFDRKDIEKGKWQKCTNCGEMLYSGILENFLNPQIKLFLAYPNF